MDNRATWVNQLREKLPSILEDLPVLIAYLYGSTASGRTTSISTLNLQPRCSKNSFFKRLREEGLGRGKSQKARRYSG